MLLGARQRLRLRGRRQTLSLEVAHLGAVLVLLSQIICVKGLVLLLEHFEVSLVVAFEFIPIPVLHLLLLPVVLLFLHISFLTIYRQLQKFSNYLYNQFKS